MQEEERRSETPEVLVEGLTSSSGPLHLFADHRGRQVDGEGERGLLGVLDHYTGLADLLGHHVLVFCRLKKKQVFTTSQ